MATSTATVSGSEGRAALALRMRLARSWAGGALSRRTSRVTTPTADGHVTPGKYIVSDGPLGAPAAEPSNSFSRLAEVCAVRSPTAPKGVPSSANLERGGCDLAEHVGVPAGVSLEESLSGRSSSVEGNEAGPQRVAGLPDVRVLALLVRRAPDGLGRVVEVPAEDKPKLAGTEHELEGEVASGGEVVVHRVQDGEVEGVEP